MTTRTFTRPDGTQSGAVFSDCERYRYRLWRTWDHTLPQAVLLAMNPSTADEKDNDPTIERWERRVQKWNEFCNRFGGVVVVNIFAFRETDSVRLQRLHARGDDIIGTENDFHISEVTNGAGIIVCGWGKPGELGGRGKRVADSLRASGRRLHALAVNADGSPKHPLYIGYAASPQVYS